jgi:hypothetical protein
MNKITLNWGKPLSLHEFERGEMRADCPALQEAGVYMWCAKLADCYVVTYVGKADDTVEARLVQHVAYIRGGRASLFALHESATVCRDEDFRQAYIPEYDSPPDEELKRLIDVNMKSTYVVATAKKDWAAVNNGEVRTMDVEGAIQIHLRRQPESRKYLMTGVSSYALRDVVLHNTFHKGVRVLGLERPIAIPSR